MVDKIIILLQCRKMYLYACVVGVQVKCVVLGFLQCQIEFDLTFICKYYYYLFEL